MATTDGNRLAKRRRLRLIMYASGWKIKDCGDGASVMPVRVVDDFTSELPHAPRRAEALRNSAHGHQFSRWTGRNRNSSLSAMQRENAHLAEKKRSANSGFSVGRQDLRRRKMRIARGQGHRARSPVRALPAEANNRFAL